MHQFISIEEEKNGSLYKRFLANLKYEPKIRQYKNYFIWKLPPGKFFLFFSVEESLLKGSGKAHDAFHL